MKWIFRKMYSMVYWLCDKCAPSDAPVFKGFYTRFRKPTDIPDEEIEPELNRILKEAMKDSNDPILDLLKRLFNDEMHGFWYAGTLEVGPYAAHPSGWELIDGMFGDSRKKSTEYTQEEKYWWSKLYVKHKKPEHHYYSDAVKFIAQYEKEME